ncbi:unnamed protein product [Macrosiphum euphorbiae]|uniref:Uncharacterized protein n=1 Tax=Macrosiphum euphorbiae TaxID=13131 RepID=A0AAV0XZC8_9HEMI|nr:unnamed protein product [Macrosiphum euphorbiae]
MEGKIDNLIKAVSEIKSTQNKLVSMMNSQSEKMSSLTSKVNDLTSKLDILSSDNESLKLRVSTIEDNLNKTNISNFSSSNNLIAEMLDIQSRQKNILLFNLSEPTSLSNDSNVDDLTAITKIFEFLGLQIKPTSISRLGSRSSTASKPRPIKLTLSDQKEVFSIFAAQNKLKTHQAWTNLRFSSDRTKAQRDFMIHLRNELLRRRENGEPELIIKYVKGTPAIINSKNV